MPDAPADAASDRYDPGECEPLDVHEVDRDVLVADCGVGCVQVTRTPGRAQHYDVFGGLLAYTDAWTVEPGVGWVDLAEDREERFDVPEGGSPPSVATDGAFVYYSKYDPAGAMGLVWKVDRVARCRKLLLSLPDVDEKLGHVPDDLDAEGRWLVYFDQRWGVGRQDLFAWDLEQDREIQLTNDRCCVGNDRLFRTTVVYLGWATSPRRIWALDILEGGARQLWESRGEQDNPAVHGRRVVFEVEADFADPNTDIHEVDLITGEHSVVTENDAPQNYPDVFGDLVVWEDHRNEPVGELNENIDIYGRDLVSGSEVAITSLPDLENRPRLWGTTVYFAARIGEVIQVFATPFPR